jgi:transposase
MRNVALDLGVKKTTYCEVAEGRIVQRATVTEVSSLVSLLGPNQPPARVAIEACREAWFVHDLLVGWGNEVLVVDTTRIRQLGIGQHHRKTDRIDAEVLARALERGGIPLAHVLSPARRELRRVLGVRRALVEMRAQSVTTIRGLLREQGHKLPNCMTRKFAARVRETKLDESASRVIEPLLKVVERLDLEIQQSDAHLIELCAQEPIVALLTTAPGVGMVVAACLVSVLDEAGRFRRAHQVESYVGLVPSENSSGGKRRLGAISKQGNSYLRALLIQSAWGILRTRDNNDPLYLWGAAVAERRGKRIAAVALARRLLGVLWAMWRDGTTYDAPHLSRQGARGLRGAAQTLEQQQAALTRAANKRSITKFQNRAATTTASPPKTSATKAA